VPSQTNARKFKVGGVHYALQRIDAAEPHDNLVAAELLETLGNLITDKQFVGRLLLLRELEIRQPRAD
jgi:hypothetical protein